MRRIRTVAVVSLMFSVMGATPSPAMAAPPANDTYSGREVLYEPLPIWVSADTTEATTDADDADVNVGCGSPATDASVWFEYTPIVGGDMAINTLASDYSVGAIVATGEPGAWSVESCGSGVVPFLAMPGTTYTILVMDVQVDGGGNGGSLEFSISRPVSPPTIEVSVEPRGTFDARTGVVTLTGTYVCASRDGGTVGSPYLDVTLSQRAGRVFVQGGGSLEPLLCDGTTQVWTVTTDWATGRFRGGLAEARMFAEACGEESCGDFQDVQAVKLSAGKEFGTGQ